MKKKNLLAITLSLALILGACGGSAKTNVTDEINHNHDTEVIFETETKNSIVVDESVSEIKTEITTDTGAVVTDEVNETENSETNVTEKSETNETVKTDKSTTNKTDTGKSDSNKSETFKVEIGKPDSNKTNTNKSDTNKTDSKKDETNKTDTKKDETNKTDTKKDETTNTGNNNVTTTPTPETCKHTGKTYAGLYDGYTHAICCWDCDAELYFVNCNYSGGTCECGLVCPHRNTTSHSDSSLDGQCGYICNDCGVGFTGRHTTYWNGSGTICSYCDRFWPCDHSDTYVLNGGGEHLIGCKYCGTTLSSGACSYVNGTCTECGDTDPNYTVNEPVSNPVEEPSAEPSVEP